MRNVSPSKVSTYQDCKRKFYLKYIVGIREEQTADTDRGKTAHKVAEVAYLSGVAPPDDPIGRIAAVYLEELPPRRPGIHVELPFALETYPGGPAMYGIIDHIDVPQAVVTDLKTVRKSFYFSKTPMELLTDPQMVSYAVEAHRLNPAAREIVVRHVSVIAESKKLIPPSEVTPVTFDPRRLLAEWRLIVHQVREMRELEIARPDPLAVEPTPTACRKYNGCPYRQICGYTDDKPLGGFMMTQSLEEMRRMQMQNGNGVAIPPGYYLPDGFQIAPAGPYGPAMVRPGDGQIFPLPQVPQGYATAPSNVVPIQSAQPLSPSQALSLPPGYVAGGTNHLVPLGYYVPAGYWPMDPDASGPRMQDANGKIFNQPRAEQAPATFPANAPPPAAGFAPPMPPAQPLPPINPPQQAQAAPPAQQQTTVPIQPPPPQQAQQQPSPVAPQPAAPATSTAGPGRPKGSKSKKTAEAAAGVVEGPEPLELWVDVLARKGAPDTTTLEEWMLPALDRARQLTGGVDWRAVDYEKGKGPLFQALAEHAKASPPSGVLLVRSAMAGADVAIEVLTPYAARVVEAWSPGGRR